MSKKEPSNGRTFFSQLVETKLIEKGFLTKDDLRFLASISYTEAELLRMDTHSKRFNKVPKAASGLATLVRTFFNHLKTQPRRWFQDINGAVENDRLVIKS